MAPRGVARLLMNENERMTPHPPARVLLADDQPDILGALRLLLGDAGFDTDAVTSTDAVLDRLRASSFDLLLMDLNYTRDTTSGREGLELLSQVRGLDKSLPVVVMTGWGSIDTAVEAMRRGARSFVQKPWEDSTLLEVVSREIEEARAARRRDRKHEREQEEARLIQRGLLPAVFPEVPGLAICGVWQPAGGFGGDCFDVLRVDPQNVALTIADISGKGLPAALLMASLQAAVRAFAFDAASPRDLCARLNRLLCGNMAAGKFATFCYCAIDAGRRVVTYANAGHNPPILVRASGDVVRFTEGGTVLGVFPEVAYEQAEVPLAAGDRIVLFTDGITEARAPDGGEEFGDDRLVALAVGARQQTAVDLHRTIMTAVQTFTTGQFDDDATLIVVSA